MKCDIVFEGGGVKGVAFIGAIQETEQRGYQFCQIAGTSAGSVIASLLAVGYTGKELEELILELNFRTLIKANWIARIPLIGQGIAFCLKKGVYSGSILEEWLQEKLNLRGLINFGDLPKGKLKIIVSDISKGELVVLPDDLHKYGMKWESFPISKAVQMSCMIPYYFQPVLLKYDHQYSYILDGGLLSNYPIWLFDSNSTPRWPTFGFRTRASDAPTRMDITGPISISKAILSTLLEAHDRRFIAKHDAARTIFIPADNVKSTDFTITLDQKKELIELGSNAARRFFENWSFSNYVLKYRT